MARRLTVVWSGTVRERFIRLKTDGRHQAFGLPQGHTESGAQHQAGLNGKVRVTVLASRGGTGGRFPQRDGIRGNPQGQAAALLKAGFVLWPVGDGVFCFRNMVAFTGVMFMRHR